MRIPEYGIGPVVAVIAVLAMLCVVRVASAREVERQAFGSFTVEAHVRRVSSGGFPNTSGNPFKTMPVSEYRVLFRGKRVAELPKSFWRAWVIESDHGPAILAANREMFLLHERDGALQVERVLEAGSDFAGVQWLDADAGQPSSGETAGVEDTRGVPLRLQGGRWLYLGHRRVLDVRTLRHVDADPSWYGRVPDGWYVGTRDALAFAPDAGSLVFIASRGRDLGHDYALAVFDLRTTSATVLPIDRDATRLYRPYEADLQWLGRHYTWHADAKGRRRLALRDGVTPEPWHGQFVATDTDGSGDYRWRPVDAGLMKPLQDYLAREFAATPRTERENGGGPLAECAIEGHELCVWYQPDERTLSLFKCGAWTPQYRDAYALVRRIGDGFDATLRAGLHQQHFLAFGVND